jgi:DNA-binding transcriptional LysR family regulator
MDLSQRVRSVLSFVQSVEAGSFAAAARLMGVSPAAVSKNVAGLEQALNIRLLNRTTRTLSLTEEGKVFLRQARVALDALDAAADAVAEQRDEVSGTVRISTSTAFGRDHVLPLLPALMADFPQLKVELDCDDRVVDLIAGGYDLALRGGQITDSSLIGRHVCHLRMVLVASPAYLRTAGIPAIPEQLAQHRLIARRFLGGKLSPWRFRLPDGTTRAIVPEQAALTLSAPEALADAACQGVGIAQVGVHHAWKHLREGRLKLLMYGIHDPGSYEMVLQYPHRAFMAPRVRVTVDYLLQTLAADPALHVPPESLPSYCA